MTQVKLAMIAAVAHNGVIGNGGVMPWSLPTDFRFYKATTMGKPLVMGRKTFESIGRPLPGRTNIVVSRSDFAHDGVIVFDNLERAIAYARTLAEQSGVEEFFVNGGGELYRQALPIADRLYLTHIDAALAGDVSFPAFEAADWTVTAIEGFTPGAKDSHPFTIRRYDRRRSPGFD